MTGDLDAANLNAPNPNLLRIGDLCEIQYRIWRHTDGIGDHVAERWFAAEIVACEQGAWPLARLADGQLTEIRPFMTWRIVLTAQERSASIAA